MKKQKTKGLTSGLTKVLIILLALFIVVGPISWRNALAASSSVSISDGAPSVGDGFTVTVYYSGDSFGSVDGALTYDASVLQYDSCTAQANGGNGEVTYSHYQATGENSMAVTFYFTVIGSGSCTITANSYDIYNYDGNSLGGDATSASISVAGSSSETETPSSDNQNSSSDSNANLKEFSIACGPLSPAFSPDITSYKVTASANETDVDITAVPENPDAEVTFGGSPVLEQDHVVREVTVTAPDGTTKVYSIEITRNLPEGAISIDGTLYVPSQNQSLSDIPAGFLASKMTYGEKEINVLKSRDGNVVLVKLVPDGAEDSEAKWFAYNQTNKSFTPSEIITIGDNKYVVVRSGMSLVYGGPENASGYSIYNPETGEINQVQIQGLEPVETNDTEPQEGETPSETTPENTTPADNTKKGLGFLWFLLFLILALVIALVVLKLLGKLGGKNRDNYSKYDNDDEDSIGSKILLTLAGLKESITSKFSKSESDEIFDDVDPEEAGMSARRIERRRRIAEAEARAAQAEADNFDEVEDVDEEVDDFIDLGLDSTPISEGSVVTKAELQAAKIAAAERATQEAARAAEEAKAAREAAEAAIAARDAARAAKARVASSELNSKMDELLEAGAELTEAVKKKED